MHLTGGPDEIPLLGGDVTDGIVRVGDTVRRPVSSRSPFIHTVLKHLEHAGFDGAPRYLGLDAKGRENLDFVDGEVAGRPWPSWVADRDRGISVARLLRRLDDAMQPFGVPEAAESGARPFGSPEPVGPPDTFVSHCDVTPENTVFRDQMAYAFIDFDLARPTSRAATVANLLLWWAGWHHPADRDPVFDGVDVALRGRDLADAYGLDRSDREWVPEVSLSIAERSWYSMRDRAERLGGGWRRMWDDGVGDAIRRREQWLRDSQTDLHEALMM